jgi:DNA-binding transcriptional ArsR family regulator
MDDIPGVARIAALLADPARAAMVWSLIDGTTRPAGELAYAANVSAQSASGHLAKLVEGGLLAASAQGRHRYFRLANAEVAALVETLASLCVASRPRTPPAPALAAPRFVQARTCYGHLAGGLAVELLERMVAARWLRGDGADYALTRTGERNLSALGVDLEAARASRRAFARACVDLTQRRPHLGGALGDALLDLYVARGWILRRRGTRVVTVTPKGAAKLAALFG